MFYKTTCLISQFFTKFIPHSSGLRTSGFRILVLIVIGITHHNIINQTLLAQTVTVTNQFDKTIANKSSDRINPNYLDSLKEKLEYDLKKYETTPVSEIQISDVIETLNSRTDNYIKFQKIQCGGDYSAIEINEAGEQRIVNKKLSKLEKKLCMLELVNFQRKFTEVVFGLRKRLLVKQQEKQLEDLESYRRQQIDDLEKMASKYK